MELDGFWCMISTGQLPEPHFFPATLGLITDNEDGRNARSMTIINGKGTLPGYTAIFQMFGDDLESPIHGPQSFHLPIDFSSKTAPL